MRIRIALLGALCACVVLVGGATTATANPSGTALVISQVYGGGGNTNATYTHDYIEIYNPTTTLKSLEGMSLQYASATGTGNFVRQCRHLHSMIPHSRLVLIPGARHGIFWEKPDEVKEELFLFFSSLATLDTGAVS